MLSHRTNSTKASSRSSRTMTMIVHRSSSSTSSYKNGESYSDAIPVEEEQEHFDRAGSGPDESNNIHSISRNSGYKASSLNITGRSSKTVHLVGFFAIGSVCLLFSLGFFLGRGPDVQQQQQQSPVDSLSSFSNSDVVPSTSTTTTVVDVTKTKSKTPSNTVVQEQEDDGKGLTVKALKALIADLAGQDERIMRWNANKYTSKRQRQGGCSMLRHGLAVILDADASDERKRYAAEYATWCITDNHIQREIFSQYHEKQEHQEGDIHEAVVQLVVSKDDMASAMAGHLIYIASFSNAKNQQTFFEKGAVEALAKVVMNKQALPVQIMWAAAALQNLAASYCQTEHDGRCYWDWNDKDNHVVINQDSLPVVSDGAPIRQAMLNMDGLVQALTEWTCTGPVQGQASDTNVFPGTNGKVGRDDANPHLMAWAAAGAIKNIALEPTAKTALKPVMSCLCLLKSSPDWLEQLKAQDALHFLRRGEGPCWFMVDGENDGGEDGTPSSSTLCIDDNFYDAEEYSCDGYGNPEEGDCDIVDALFPHVTASQACCACGGGTTIELDQASRP